MNSDGQGHYTVLIALSSHQGSDYFFNIATEKGEKKIYTSENSFPLPCPHIERLKSQSGFLKLF